MNYFWIWNDRFSPGHSSMLAFNWQYWFPKFFIPQIQLFLQLHKQMQTLLNTQFKIKQNTIWRYTQSTVGKDNIIKKTQVIKVKQWIVCNISNINVIKSLKMNRKKQQTTSNTKEGRRIFITFYYFFLYSILFPLYMFHWFHYYLCFFIY